MKSVISKEVPAAQSRMISPKVCHCCIFKYLFFNSVSSNQTEKNVLSYYIFYSLPLENKLFLEMMSGFRIELGYLD